MSDMNDPKSGALEPIRTEALDTVRPPAQQLRWNARATHRAMQGWQRIQSQEDWERINEESGEQYESGAFLLERLGADRFLDPRLMATILALRQRLIAESGITTAAETMLVDQAVLSYYHTLRVQGWIGDLAVRIEHEFFGDDAFTEMARKGHRRADRFAVEDRVRQLSEQLMSLSDRANRMMIRNLKAIKELRQGQVPAVAIGRADQVTVTSRPGRRLRAVKTELPQGLSNRAVRIAERSSDTIETRPDTTSDAITSAPTPQSGAGLVAAVGENPKRRRRQRERSAMRPAPRRRPHPRHPGSAPSGSGHLRTDHQDQIHARHQPAMLADTTRDSDGIYRDAPTAESQSSDGET
jgi:hypothetical protein